LTQQWQFSSLMTRLVFHYRLSVIFILIVHPEFERLECALFLPRCSTCWMTVVTTAAAAAVAAAAAAAARAAAAPPLECVTACLVNKL
jgi:hypothetical protein